jgi:hypothetical protein
MNYHQITIGISTQNVPAYMKQPRLKEYICYDYKIKIVLSHDHQFTVNLSYNIIDSNNFK